MGCPTERAGLRSHPHRHRAMQWPCEEDLIMRTLTRRAALAATTVASVGALLPAALRAGPDAGAIRPFRIDVPQQALDDLRRRIAGTRWPDRETVPDASQGAPLEKLQALVRYWGTDYDWRQVETRLNTLPQFLTGIDGVDIHFIHVRSPQANALPLIMTHGWPGSIMELVNV